MNFILIAVVVLGVIGLISAIVLFATSKRFAVKEDFRINEVAAVLPQANCGGCGYAGCSGFAAACVKTADSGSLGGKLCPVGGQAVMLKVASILKMSTSDVIPKIAVVRCNGTCDNRPRTAKYDGLMTCRAVHACGAGETACGYGCLGCGDCVDACKFDAIHVNPETMIPEVDENKCVACGACSKACPRNIIEMRLKGNQNRRIYVDCVNHDKGPVAMKVCKVSCIACGKCDKVCEADAITIDENLAYIDDKKCTLCGLCENVCPRHAIVSVNLTAELINVEIK
jgi:Na+-translocating ferredoxin:NAD+ oxidoreductase subunit B